MRQDGEEDDDAFVRQQIRAGAGRGLSAAPAPPAAAAGGARRAADVFTAAPPQRSAATATAGATPEHVAAAAAAVMASLQTSMRQLQARTAAFVTVQECLCSTGLLLLRMGCMTGWR